MRIMIFGDSASGKSTFAETLAIYKKLPVTHLDTIMDRVGRSDRRNIGEIIKAEASKEDWIIEGNAFTKDESFRIERADVIYVFDFNRFSTLANLIKRHIKQRQGRELRKGSEDTRLNLSYFIPYILIKFPPRKKAAIEIARKQSKRIIVFKTYNDVNNYLESQS